ncbi:zinc-binding dehydrogenase [Propionibacteriaceae bacterium Y1923]
MPAAPAIDGRVVNIGRLAGPASNIDLDALSSRHLTVHGVSFGFSRHQQSVPSLAGLEAEVLPAVGRGEVRPIIDSTYPIEDVEQATDRLRSGITTCPTPGTDTGRSASTNSGPRPDIRTRMVSVTWPPHVVTLHPVPGCTTSGEEGFIRGRLPPPQAQRGPTA